MLSPKRTKFRKVQKGRMKGNATRGNKLTYGEFGIQALESAWITANQIEAARVTLSRYTKKFGKTWIKIFPDKPITKKPAETRMGSGKGNPEYFVAVVKPGRIMFEIAGIPEVDAREALRKAIHKLPIKCQIIRKEGLVIDEAAYRAAAKAAQAEEAEEQAQQETTEQVAEETAQEVSGHGEE